MFKRVVEFWTSVWKPLPLRTDSGTPLEGERRGLTRHPRNLEVSCRVLNKVALPCPGAVQDVSAGGMALLTNRPFDPETLLSIEWPRPMPGIPPAITVRVLRTNSEPGGNWRVGCAFAADLSEGQLQTLLEALG